MGHYMAGRLRICDPEGPCSVNEPRSGTASSLATALHLSESHFGSGGGQRPMQQQRQGRLYLLMLLCCVPGLIFRNAWRQCVMELNHCFQRAGKTLL